ncbi:ead/Ea22-like family protein [Enterobacter hormaechei subsp. steigerwaltii]|uniref:ead/Ea22-like family protein n=1 Tax=Enterobacter hormaechei TaxID=158836 RepID=UPI00079A4EE8|nr:ead/Ea22-like family protein [Enterobacter hormaechei]MCU2290202.1 ead/Ea22-like family protein [Enterobacter hormaechei subsp. steigerwaltii]HBM2813511.1 ead/Ea22-like family protein [Enterobacter hormaechei subsp. xiangfangensis]EKW1881344.1 ead/Ea22-like family protein [Enterobacter hormaechei]MCU2296917.1 ead/Ea22-like family protein [Enterobacter hormaechei subsp. steigerwaltii]MCU2320916.1 ead/Ea22-like family protein [Enterobacter hormaechei subsp. steigerwaltii]
MSNIDKQALREAAEKALPAMQRLLMMPNDELFDEALLNVDGDVDAANAFNLLTGPETVLALLDELEAKDKQIADLKEAFSIALSAAGIDVPAAAAKGE